MCGVVAFFSVVGLQGAFSKKISFVLLLPDQTTENTINISELLEASVEDLPEPLALASCPFLPRR
jgi:hypothetical protein